MLIHYILQLADNALINGHRLSEWCGHGPVLEQDIAISNIALDHLGAARSFYQYAAELINQLPQEERMQLFASTAIQQKIAAGGMLDEDDLAYLRDGWDFRNILLVEQPNKDWAYTVARSFFLDAYNYFAYQALAHSSDAQIAAIAEKSLKEATYHLRWSSEWIIRLGDGTEESYERIQAAVNDRWMHTEELFQPGEAEKALLVSGVSVDLKPIQTQWMNRVSQVFAEATLKTPGNGWTLDGGKEGRHSEHLGYILAEMQFMQRAYPGMTW